MPSRSSSHSVFVVQGWRLVDIAREIGCTAPMVGIMVRTGRHTGATGTFTTTRGSVPLGAGPKNGFIEIPPGNED